jgi:hypothetical protein
MEFREISDGRMTLLLDPDDAAILAAACQVAEDMLLGCQPSESAFRALGEEGTLASLLGAYRAGFEASMTAAVALFNLPPPTIPDCTLAALRARGPGWRRPQRNVPVPADEGHAEPENLTAEAFGRLLADPAFQQQFVAALVSTRSKEQRPTTDAARPPV